MSRSKSRMRRRDNLSIANPRLPFSLAPRLSPLSLYEDRRQFHPLGSAAPASSFSSPRSRLSLRDRRYVSSKSSSPGRVSFPSQTKAAVAFSTPGRVLVCVRRHTRKEVLHALRKTGRVGQKRPRRNLQSLISCRR